MSRSGVELDFFRIEKESSAKPQVQKKLFDRRRSFRDIQSVISKINPELLKTVIASASVNKSPFDNGNLFSIPSTPKEDHNSFLNLPVYTPTFRHASISESAPENAPLTIFYHGTVAVFDVPRDKAENILKLALEKGSNAVGSTDSKFAVSPNNQRQILETLNGDLPIARRKSLERFLEKRKERLTLVSPYGCPAGCTFSGEGTPGPRD